MLRTFQTRDFGLVRIETKTYASNGAIAIEIWEHPGDTEPWDAPICKLSVNIPERAKDLPPFCFFLKDWSENKEIAAAAKRSGWFRRREDVQSAQSGWVVADVWELLEKRQGE